MRKCFYIKGQISHVCRGHIPLPLYIHRGRLQPGEGATSIFIYPGYRFKAVDGLFTNFHTPRSTLLMLVSAFAEDLQAKAGAPDAEDWGRGLILESYAEGIRRGYRFYSYGDAMLVR